MSRLPVPLPPARTAEFYPRAYRGSGRTEPVLVSIDLNASGGVERVQAILPPPPPAGAGIRALLIDRSGERLHGEPRGRGEPARLLDPLFARAAEANVKVMRFSPAELDGKPVAFSGLRITIVFSDPAIQT